MLLLTCKCSSAARQTPWCSSFLFSNSANAFCYWYNKHTAAGHSNVHIGAACHVQHKEAST